MKKCCENVRLAIKFDMLESGCENLVEFIFSSFFGFSLIKSGKILQSNMFVLPASIIISFFLSYHFFSVFFDENASKR